MICVVEIITYVTVIIVYVMVVMMYVMVIIANVMVIIECVTVHFYVYLEDDDYLNKKFGNKLKND